MARIIVNEGGGPQSYELSGIVTVGSNPSCDVVLTHPSTLGFRLKLKPLKYGYRARLVKGDLVHNERPCDMADLDHNDTMRVGDVLAHDPNTYHTTSGVGCWRRRSLQFRYVVDGVEQPEALSPTGFRRRWRLGKGSAAAAAAAAAPSREPSGEEAVAGF